LNFDLIVLRKKGSGKPLVRVVRMGICGQAAKSVTRTSAVQPLTGIQKEIWQMPFARIHRNSFQIGHKFKTNKIEDNCPTIS
jgi:hypothetical protein